MSLRSSLEDNFVPQEMFDNVWSLFFIVKAGRGVIGPRWVEATDAATQPTKTRQSA